MGDLNIVTARQALPVCGAVLTGGQSSRMGRPKAELVLPNHRSMLAHCVGILLDVLPKILVCGPPAELPEEFGSSVSFISDIRHGLGPLAGLETLLASGVADSYLVLACDQPLVTAAMARRLLSEYDDALACVYTHAQTIHPMPGYYDSSLLPVVTEAIVSGRRALISLVKIVDGRLIVASSDEVHRLESVNTPEQYYALALNWQNFLQT